MRWANAGHLWVRKRFAMLSFKGSLLGGEGHFSSGEEWRSSYLDAADFFTTLAAWYARDFSNILFGVWSSCHLVLEQFATQNMAQSK